MNEGKNLKQLGSKTTDYSYDNPTLDILESFSNKYPGRKYKVVFETEEFTSLCPKTGQPDFAKITICYIPDKLCVETKSLKLYLFSYRNYGSFMETITNKIMDDLVSVINPLKMDVIGEFKVRGGIALSVFATHERKDA